MTGEEGTRLRRVGMLPVSEDDRDWVGVGYWWDGDNPDTDGVSLLIREGDAMVQAILSPVKALWIANRLQRAANFALESGEDPPDISLEVRKFTGGDPSPD